MNPIDALRVIFDPIMPDRTLLVIERDAMEFAREMTFLHPTSSLVALPDAATCTSGEVIDMFRVALTAFDIGRRIMPDLVIVVGIYDAALTNKSLPANLSNVKTTRSRRVVFVLDARDRDARQALMRRDFLRTLGPIIWGWWRVPMPHVEHVNPKDKERELRAYVKALDSEDSRKLLDVDRGVDTWAQYENLASARPPLRRTTLLMITDSFLLSAKIDKLAQERDYYSLTSIAEGIREVAAASAVKLDDAKKSTQFFTRCGMHANISRNKSAYS